MKFSNIVNQASALLQDTGRITYRALKREFDLDEEALDDLREELIVARRVALDEEGKVLVWAGSGESLPVSTSSPSPAPAAPIERQSPQADRRQLTVMFCDLVGSTPMSAQLDPEDYRDIMQAYQEMCGQVLARFTGHIARYEGDGILVYFGYPQAQEDAAAQAVHAGLRIIESLPDLNARFQPRFALLQERPLQVRIGLHTGLVVVGEMGSEQYRIDIAVGETPNMAARIQGQAGPNEIMISAATYKLVEGLFACEERGPRELKGIASPQAVYLVMAESAAHDRFEAAVQKGLTPLVGREEESGLLRQRWERAQAGTGQVVLLSGEPGIGKSRLVQELKDHTTTESPVSVECRCSPNTQNSALAPIIEHLQRLLCFERNESPEAKLHKLEQTLSTYDFALADSIPLLASLLSLPMPESYPPLQFSPQKQKQKTLELLLIWLRKDAERQPVRVIFEDLHWADPSTLEFLTLLVEQVATMRALLVLTFRPEFTPPWPVRSHLFSLHLDRLPAAQIAQLAQYVAGRALPAEVVQQLITKTDGVPLFAEELTKMVIESGYLQATEGRYELTSPLQEVAIPTTLQDSLRARLDRLNTAREIAQIGATIGREFSYDLLQAVSAMEESALQQGLRQLVGADLVSQKGIPPQAQYVFKHALIQDSAYQSVLRSTRHQYHQKIARVLEEQFTETTGTQPELVAHHYTEAGLAEQAIPYWQQAGQRASQRSAHAEAIGHLTKGLEVLNTLPDTPERAEQELSLQIALGTALLVTKGMATPEVASIYTRARELCQQIGETPQLLPVLYGLRRFYSNRAEYQAALEIGEQFLKLAQRVDPRHLLGAHYTSELYWLGEFVSARAHLEEGVALYNRQQHHSLALVYGTDPGVTCLTYLAWTLWNLGYPEQARTRLNEVITLTQELSHSFTVGYSLVSRLFFHQLRREGPATQEQAEALLALANDQGFPQWMVFATVFRGWAVADQGRGEEGVAQIRQGLASYRAMGARVNLTHWLGLLTEAYGKTGQAEKGLTVLAEAFAVVQETGERAWEAELYRLKGELTLQQFNVQGSKFQVQEEVEACFQQALGVARHQEAKSLELRAATSLARLWQQQGKTVEAHQLLAEIYHWFSEGFDTKDLQEAKALLEELS